MIFVKKGDAPLDHAQAINRGMAMLESEKAQYIRETGVLMGDPEYVAWANQWLNDNVVNGANNTFNHQLATYRKSVARLARYRVADGRPEITENQPTGEMDPATGAPIMQMVVTQTAVDPLPATVDEPVYDANGAQTGTTAVPNPEIVTDDSERAAAQAVIDAMPADVKAF